MNDFSKKLWAWNQPQLFSLILAVLIICGFCVFAYFKIKKTKPSEAPKGVVLLAEMYVTAIDQTFDETVDGKLPNARHYIFTLFTLLLVGNLLALFGFEPIGTSYSIPLTLTIASWFGIFVTGFIYQKFKYLKKYLNPFDIIGTVAPLISLGFRLYGNLIGGGVVMFLIYSIFGYIWTQIPNMGNHKWFFLAPVITPFFHFYFDIFESLIQSYVFAVLTMNYWLAETGENQEKEIKKTKVKSNFKRIKINRKFKTSY
ncbi:F0F1 ATP synthase subunit A [Mycoplasmopsis cricetuli]|uniref:F0F1 ATP synthase subunit A n=1 Tax=Mycoplasmopsis cricetuli TaxID=171283 RepID=UPI0004718A0E|nr:F0F1 ATP synthase subunit A [Mycoplasmopsis cricetuli]